MKGRFRDYGLRDRKRAKTRVALVEALVPRLASRSLDDISVAELADEVGVSAGTVFNYFPTKAQLLTHTIQLWSLRMARHFRDHLAAHGHPLAAVEALYLETATELRAGPGVMMEIIAHQARHGHLEAPEVELVERLLYLDDDPDAATLTDRGAGELIAASHIAAVQRGILPGDTHIELLTLGIASVFFGVPLLVGHDQPEAVGPLYQLQLRTVWRGAGADLSGMPPLLAPPAAQAPAP